MVTTTDYTLSPVLPPSPTLSPSHPPALPPSFPVIFFSSQFAEGEWFLDEPEFVQAIYLDVTSLECPLPLQDREPLADFDMETFIDRPLARWQIKVSEKC